MAEERIDVQVTDKVDSGIAKKLNQIADSAQKGESYIKRLKAALSNINSSALDRLAAAMAKADSAQAKLINAQARLTTAQQNGSIAAQKVALAQQKIATEAARTEAAQARAATATAQAALASQRLAAAQNATAGASNAAAAGSQHAAAAAGANAAATNAAANATRNYAGAAAQATAASNGLGTANQRAAAGFGNTVNAANQYARAARQTTAVNANIIAQMQDIGVSLAGGQNPLLVMIQQGSQLSYIASTLSGGWKQLLGVVGQMLVRFLPLISVLGLLALAFNSVKEAAASDAELKKFSEGLGLTKKELKQLDDVTVTWGDTFKATLEIMAEGMGTTADDISNKWNNMWSKIGEFARFSIAIIIAGFAAFGRGAASIFINLGKAVGAFFVGAANLAVGAFEKMINYAIGGLNKVSGMINGIFGTDLAAISEVKFDKIQVDFDFTNPLTEMKDQLYKTYNEVQGEFDKISARATQKAKERIATQAKQIIDDRTPKAGPKGKKDNSEEKRAEALAKINLQLDNELARMKLLKDERVIQQRMDQIEESLAAKKIKLNDAERASIEGKVRAIEQFKIVQSEMDRIYEEVTGPQKQFDASLEAANILLEKGVLNLEQYAAQLNKAKQEFLEATDPTHKFNEEIDKQQQLLGKYGVELERAIYLQGVEQEYKQRGLSIYDAATGKLREEVALLVAKNNALMQQQFIQSQLAGVLNPILGENQEIAAQTAVYAELDRLRQADLIREGDYQRAKAALWLKYNEYKLNATADFFGALAQVTRKGHGVVGAISKAAAVAEATIQGYLAVQKALASAPPPWNYIAAAAVAMKTGAQVAGILSTNVGNYKDGGQFIVRGRDGVDANNINMNVTKGERVTIETAAQQRENDKANGAAPIVDARTKVLTLFDPQSFLAEMETEEGERIIMNIVRRNQGGGEVS